MYNFKKLAKFLKTTALNFKFEENTAALYSGATLGSFPGILGAVDLANQSTHTYAPDCLTILKSGEIDVFKSFRSDEQRHETYGNIKTLREIAAPVASISVAKLRLALDGLGLKDGDAVSLSLVPLPSRSDAFGLVIEPSYGPKARAKNPEFFQRLESNPKENAPVVAIAPLMNVKDPEKPWVTIGEFE